jgi:hypothetical protein
MFGMPGMRIVSAITSSPTRESLTNPDAVGAHSTIGAKTSQMPTKQAPHQAIGRSGLSARQPSTTSRTPVATSDHVISDARSTSYVWSENHTPRPPLGTAHRSSSR